LDVGLVSWVKIAQNQKIRPIFSTASDLTGYLGPLLEQLFDFRLEFFHESFY